MKLIAPDYYENFACIAGKCKHSCCIGWEIDIDSVTFEKYKKLKSGYGEFINNSIVHGDMPHFKLLDCDRCPHLDESGLCRIIINFGEEYLSDICRNHPRFFNYTSIAEVGIGMCCMEAARIILSSPDYAVFEEVGSVEVLPNNDAKGVEFRGKIFSILQSTGCNYNLKLKRICREFEIDVGLDSYWLEIINSLEYLKEEHKELFMHYSSKKRPKGVDEYLERFLAYFIYRHCTEALNELDFCERLSFCLFCERLFASLIFFSAAKTLNDVAAIARIISEEIEYSEDNTFALMY